MFVHLRCKMDVVGKTYHAYDNEKRDGCDRVTSLQYAL